MREIAETVSRVVRAVPIVHIEGRPGDIQGAEVSGERAERELGWKATTSFDEGVARYVDWLTNGKRAQPGLTVGSA